MRKKILYFLGILLFINEILLGQDKLQSPSTIVFDTIHFELNAHNNIVIKTIIGEKDTLDLMFHTAANSVSLTKNATKKTKTIVWDSQSEVRSWGGKAISRYSNNNHIVIGKYMKDSITIWEDEKSGPNTDGKFGPNLFDDYVIKVDYDNSVIVLYKALPQEIEEFLKVPLTVKNGNYFIQGISTVGGNDYKTTFLIHSGYGGSVLYDDKFLAESQIGKHIEITSEKELKDSFGNIIKIRKGILPELSLGNLKMKEVPIGFFEGKIGKQQMSIIGADMLKRFNIIIDAKREYIYLKKNRLEKSSYTQF